jgi:acyl-CoA synthetase (AMP-forming)/AMP-acid ligase II
MKELTLHRLLMHAREWYADRVAFVEGTRAETFASHIDRSLRLADGLAASGIRPGDRVALVADASSRFVNVVHAAALGGFIAVPINSRLSERELAVLLADCAPSLVVVDDRHASLVSNALALANLQVPLCDTTADLDALVAAGRRRVPSEPEEDDPLLILYSGGTTGRSKGAVANHRQLGLSTYRSQLQIGIPSPGAVLLTVNPLFHIGALNVLFAFPLAGGQVVMRPSFDPATVISDAEQHGVTHLPVVVPILKMILDHPDFRPEAFASLRTLTYGASPMPVELLTRVLSAFPDVNLQQSYGMTEAFSSVTCLTNEDHHAGAGLLSSVGRAQPGIVVSIRDPAGVELPRNTPGEVCVSSGSVSSGYWGMPPSTEPWLRTGDQARMDSDGYLFLLDRIKDMIKSGGENVFSAEVEAVIAEHPGVASVAVIGVPDPVWIERVHAEVVPRPGVELTPEDIIVFARERLAGFQTPKTVTIRTAPLPVSALGKVLKRELRASLQDQPAAVGR